MKEKKKKKRKRTRLNHSALSPSHTQHTCTGAHTYKSLLGIKQLTTYMDVRQNKSKTKPRQCDRKLKSNAFVFFFPFFFIQIPTFSSHLCSSVSSPPPLHPFHSRKVFFPLFVSQGKLRRKWENRKKSFLFFFVPFVFFFFFLICIFLVIICRFRNVREKSTKMAHQVFVRTSVSLRGSTSRRLSTSLAVKTVSPPAPRSARRLTVTPETPTTGRCCATSAGLTRARRSPWSLWITVALTSRVCP